MKTNVSAVVALLALLALPRAGAQEPPSPAKSPQIAVNVLGEVIHPGRYLLPKGATALDALGAAGGQTVDTNLKRVRCIHATTDDRAQAVWIDMKAVLAGTKTRAGSFTKATA